jgi:hypothetical protein
MKSFCLLTTLVFFFQTLSAQEISVPKASRPVLLDGKFHLKEWQDARLITVSDSLELYLKQDRDFLYWCLRGRGQQLFGVDFYIAFRDSLVNLHASAKLGERIYHNGSYGEWDWWNNQLWSANVARINSFQGQRFLKDEIKEFQLDKERVRDSPLLMMFQLDQPGEKPPAFPAGAQPESPEKWIKLKLK